MKRPLKLLGTAIQAARELCGWEIPDLLNLTVMSDEDIKSMEAGSLLPPLDYLELLLTQLHLDDQSPSADMLRMLYSKAEAPWLPLPGRWVQSWSFETQGHIEVAFCRHEKRAPGRLFDSCGSPLLGYCFWCEQAFLDSPEEPSSCRRCGFDFLAMSIHYYENSEALTRLGKAIKDTRNLIRKAHSLTKEAHGLPKRDPGAAPDATPPSVDPVLNHNRKVGKTLSSLTHRELFHYQGAKKLSKAHDGGPFTRAELVKEYVRLSKDPGNTKTVLPSDFSVGARGQATRNPWFLRKEGRGRFRFVGLNGQGD